MRNLRPLSAARAGHTRDAGPASATNRATSSAAKPTWSRCRAARAANRNRRADPRARGKDESAPQRARDLERGKGPQGEQVIELESFTKKAKGVWLRFGLDSSGPRRRYWSHELARLGRAIQWMIPRLRTEPSRRSSSLVWMVWTPRIVARLLEADQLPNLARLREQGGFARVATTRPAQTPVAWSTFATGTNPGGHGIFDFLRRNPKTYLPELALNRYEQKNVFLPPKAVNLRRGVPVWEMLAAAGKSSTVLRCPCTYPPDPVRGQMLSGMGVPDLRGGLGTSTFYTSSDAVTAT